VRQFFVDSFYLLALFNSRDAAHRLAVDWAKVSNRRLITTDWVLTEVADALSSQTSRTNCSRFVEDFRWSHRVEVIPATRELFESGWKMYVDRPDKDWSLTDCISFIVMQERGITEALTGDHHFEQAGFIAHLR
jgi:predicted nucleic acid-binding protein